MKIAQNLKDHNPKLTVEKFAKKLSDWYRRYPDNEEQIEMFPEKSSWENGRYKSDKLIAIFDEKAITPELILKLHGLDQSKWEVVGYTNNLWHGQKKGGKRLTMYQSKLSAIPITNKVTFADIESYFDGKKYPALGAIISSGYDPNGEVLEIDIADLHSGLLSWAKETGENYDVEIAKNRFLKVIEDNVERCQGRKFKKIILALLGDLIHIDNDLQTTTKGTFQQADGRIAKIFETTLDMLIEGIRRLGSIAPVDVVYTSGNHDGTSGWMLIKSLQMAFHGANTYINIDISPDPQKTRLIGNSLIGFVHGDMPEKNLSGWLQVQARHMDKSVKFLEVHSGHRHAYKVRERVQTEDNEGVVVRVLPTICSSSTWEHREGYAGATCTAMSFVWHEKVGLREMWYSNI